MDRITMSQLSLSFIKKKCNPDSLQFRKQFQHAFFAILNSSQAPCLVHGARSPLYPHLTTHTAFWSYSYLQVVKNSPYQNIFEVQFIPPCYRNHEFSCCFGLPHWEENEGWLCLKEGCWERYLGTRYRGPEATAQWQASWTVRITKHYSDEQTKKMRWAGHVARMGER
jgi:hypothetical protein